MSRDVYFDLCINASKKIGRVLRAKDVSWLDTDLVVHGGTDYYPVGYELTFDRLGMPVHNCILHDLKANSVTVARLDEVERKVRE